MKILVVEDDPNYRVEIQEELEPGFENLKFFYAGTLAEASELAHQLHPDLVLMDIIFPSAPGEELDYRAGVKLLEQLENTGFAGSMIILSSQDKTFAVELLTEYRNVKDYFFKDTSFREIQTRLRRHVEHEERKRELLSYRLDQVRLLGNSEAINSIRSLAQKLSNRDSSVLISGESGVGKEVAARYLHAASERAERCFVALNCAAIPTELFESSLFGHVKGAFTGAETDQVGSLQEAHAGCLFLDEIGELPLNMQAKLLRVLQEKSFSPVGSTRTIPADFRLIAATNRNLLEEVQKGRFREDLYYRVHVIPLEIAPLRERLEDIETIAADFLQSHMARYGGERRLSQQALEALKAYAWPGNIRELCNVLERMLLFSEAVVLGREDVERFLPLGSKRGIELQFPVADADYKELKQSILDVFHCKYFRYHLDLNSGSIRKTAEATGYNRTDLSVLCRRLNLRSGDRED